MPELILQSRILPPGKPTHIIRRERLLDILKINRDKSLILLCASAGFGKTTLVVDFLNELRQKYAWLHVSSDMKDPFLFFLYLIHSIKNQYSNFGQFTLELINYTRTDSSASKNIDFVISDLTTSFLNELIDLIKEDVFLVIDDLHNVDLDKNNWLVLFFNKLFEDVPAHVHIIITSRDAPCINISKLRSKRKILEIHNQQLEFTKEEVAMLIKEVYSDIKDEGIADLLEQHTNGWITGIHLLLQTHGSDIKIGSLNRVDETLFSYFAEDIFNKLDEDLKRFLLITSQADYFDEQLGDFIMGWNRSSEMINKLIKSNIFIHQVQNITDNNLSNTVYTYYELFKEFLENKFKLTFSEDIRKNIYSQLLEFYLAADDVFNSVKYSVKSGHFDKLIELLEFNFNSFFDRGYYHFLYESILTVPEDIKKHNAKILLYSGLLLLFYKYDLEGAKNVLDQAIQKAEENSDKNTLTESKLIKAEALLLEGKYDEIEQILGELIEDSNPLVRAKAFLHLGNLNYRQGFKYYHKALEYLSQSVEISNKEGYNSIKGKVFRYIGNIHSVWGDSVKALYFLEQSIKMEDNVYDIFRSISNIIRDYTNIGNYDKAHEYIEKAESLYEKYPTTLFQRFLLRSKAIFSFEFGDYEKSIELFNKLIEVETKAKLTIYLSATYATLGEAYYYLAQHSIAQQYYELAFDYVTIDKDYLTMILNYYIAKNSFRKNQTNGKYEKILTEMLEYYEETEQVVDKSLVNFYTADYYIRSGSPDKAVKYLTACLNISAEKSFVSFLEQELTNSRYIFDMILQSREMSSYRQFVKTIIHNTSNKKTFKWISEECRKRFEKQSDTFTDLKLCTFGRFDLYLRGIAVNEEKWVRKKGKLLLAYLLCKPDVTLTKDKIIDLFFGDIPVDNVDTVYHNTLSNIRTALKIEYDFTGREAESKKSKNKQTSIVPNFIIYEDKTLKWNPDFKFYSDYNEFNNYYEKAIHTHNQDEKLSYFKIAYSLYKGEFLPGMYDNWCEDSRHDCANKYITICEELTKLSKENKDYAGVIEYSEKLLEIDCLNENAYLNIIESYTLIGNHTKARDKFSQMLKKFEEELGDKPTKESLEIINKTLI
jgi:ATP/maltotriose-dependent transcriptional regulator MalT/DNA-binding SARP family transcriptional activator